jgi:hypothetical protein
MGNDIFDAINALFDPSNPAYAGIYSGIDMYGNFAWGVSVNQEVASFQARAGYGNDPCTYLNDAATSVDSVDQNSSPGECARTGGQWLPPQPFGTSYGVDANGNAYPITLGSRFCGVVGRIGDLAAGLGLVTWMQGRAITLSTIAEGGELVIEGSEFGPVGAGLAVGGAALQLAADACED